MLVSACTKDFLEIKPDKKQVVPTKLKDFQALLDNSAVMNAQTPNIGEIGSDDYYLMESYWNVLPDDKNRNGYIWAEDIFAGYHDNDWNIPYQQVFYANTILDALKNDSYAKADQKQLNIIRSSALFYRAWANFQLIQLFCVPYNQETKESDLGIPIRLESDINLPAKRNTIDESYSQILDDLRNSIDGLNPIESITTRPSKAASHALLSRMYLLMHDYEKALESAIESLAIYNELLDYNLINPESNYPFSLFNKETIFYSSMDYSSVLISSDLLIDTTLYNSYLPNDLRKELFFKPSKNGYTYRGSYSGSRDFFSGISVNEMLLVAAECYSRLNEKENAKLYLNRLLKTRFNDDAYLKLHDEYDDQLKLILEERRKELIFRGIRWMDLRRLNYSKETAVNLQRIIGAKHYTLKPGSKRYVIPIPDPVIRLNQIEQNDR